MNNIQKSTATIQNALPDFKPKIAVILGSGLGKVTDIMDVQATIGYSALSGFPQTNVAGHDGTALLGTVAGKHALFLKGRKHLYEGNAIESLKTMIRTVKSLGVPNLMLTNAAGSLIKSYGPGSLIAISDHINLTGTNPLIGNNDEEWGSRFPPMENAWDSDLRQNLMNAANKASISMGQGVYCQFLGPTFETPAEIGMARAIGADLVGMSTVTENIIARHCGLKCVGISAVTNLAAGMSDTTLSHDQTLEGAAKAEQAMATVIKEFIAQL